MAVEERKKNNETGDKAEDENFLSYFVEWRQFLVSGVYIYNKGE